MGEKLQQGDRFPSLALNLVDGRTVHLLDEMPTRYAAFSSTAATDDPNVGGR